MRLKQKLSLDLIKFLVLVTFASGAAPACAAEADTSFEAQCPLLLAQADSFVHACTLNARVQVRDFEPIGPEVHSAYLGQAALGSHFALGCTLYPNGQIDFLGIYYSVDGANFKFGNTAPLAYIDGDGDIGISRDNHLVNFIPVRLFQTATYSRPGFATSPSNCMPSKLGDGEFQDWAGGSYFAVETHQGNSRFIQVCIDLNCNPSEEYILYREKDDQRIIMTNEFYEYFILNDGAILVKKKSLNEICTYVNRLIRSGESLQINQMDIEEELCSYDPIK